MAGIIYVINYFLLKLHHYTAFLFCGNQSKLTEEDKKSQLSVFLVFSDFNVFWWLYTNWVQQHRQNHSRMWGCVSSCIVCSSRLCFLFMVRPLFSQQRKWAELMHLIEIKPPLKSQAVFHEMQNELHCIVTEQRHRKNLSVCYFGASHSLLTGLHSSLSRAEEMLEV